MSIFLACWGGRLGCVFADGEVGTERAGGMRDLRI
jgi:hypothetical protein